MIDINIELDRNGPIFSAARVHAAVDDFLDEASHDIAAAGLAQWRTNLDTSLRDPTPYYETQLRMVKQGDRWEVDDRGVIYGPWLEGTSSRNQTTRFKGYAAARRARQTIEQQVPMLVAGSLQRAIRRLNG